MLTLLEATKMKRKIALILIFFIILLGGCQMGKELKPSEMNPDDLPDERAFQDEFTREFLQSVEETRPGYYPFLSNTGKYKMDFPADGIISNEFYNSTTDMELLGISIRKDDGTSVTINIIFDNSRSSDKFEYYLDGFEGRIGTNVQFEIIKNNSMTIHYNNFQRNDFDNHVAYLHPNIGSGGMEVLYSVDCLDGDHCNNTNQQEIINWIKSILFIHVDERVVNSDE